MATVNLEGDLGVGYSEVRAVPRKASEMTFQIKSNEFSRRPRIGDDRIQARVLLIPPKVKLNHFNMLKEAQAEGCRVVETMSCRVVDLETYVFPNI